MAQITDWMALAAPNDEWEGAVKQMGQRPNLGAFPDIATLRQYMLASKKKMTSIFEPVPGVVEKDHQVSARDGAKIPVRVYTPEGKTGGAMVVIFHGGGYCVGGLENEELLCRRAAGFLGCVVVNVDYRLAPEHQFPIPVNDCHDATKWAAENAATLGADTSKGFIIGGTSAGGNMATVTALRCRDEKLSPAITGCLLMIPALCAESAVPEKYRGEFRSWDQNQNADILSRQACHLFTNNYVPRVEDQNSSSFSPLIWETGFNNFPTTAFQICGADPLRDEALIFERILREDEKVKTKVNVYPGLPHGFYSVIPQLKASKKYTDESLEALEWLLAQSQGNSF